MNPTTSGDEITGRRLSELLFLGKIQRELSIHGRVEAVRWPEKPLTNNVVLVKINALKKSENKLSGWYQEIPVLILPDWPCYLAGIQKSNGDIVLATRQTFRTEGEARKEGTVVIYCPFGAFMRTEK